MDATEVAVVKTKTMKETVLDNVPMIIVWVIIALVFGDLFRHLMPVLTHNFPLLLIALLVYLAGRFLIKRK